MKKKYEFSLAACVVLHGFASARAADTASDSSGTNSAQLEDVIVTARRREERALEVPISVSVQTGAQLEARNANSLQTILPQVPNTNFEFVSPRLMNIAIRGLGRNLGNDGLESSTGVFLDGVYLGRLSMAASDFTDLKQVEVLRGPQGTLFGKNTTAGVLNIVTREPRFDTEAKLDLNLGNNDLQQVRAIVGGSIIDNTLAFRLNAFDSQRDGFVWNPVSSTGLGEYDRRGVRAQLLWTVDTFKLRVIADYGEAPEDAPGILLVDPVSTYENGTTRPNNFLARSARAGYTPLLDPLERINDSDAGVTSTTFQGGISAQADWRGGGFDFTSITAWRRFHYRPEADGDFTGLDVQKRAGFELEDEQLSEEFRIASPIGGKIDYVAGVFLFEQRLDSTFNSIYGKDAADWLQAGLPSYVLDGFHVTVTGDPKTDSSAAFGQLTWHANQYFDATLGVRYTYERKTAHIDRTSTGGASLAPTDTLARTTRASVGAPSTVDVTSSEDFVSGLASVSYHISTDALAYASISYGAKSGGINVAVVTPGIDQVVKPEVATSSELGLKVLNWDGKLEWTLAAFNTDVDDYQTAIRDPLRGAIYLGNAESVRSWGFELESTYRPMADASIGVSAGWNDAFFVSFPNSSCPAEKLPQPTCDLSGSPVPGAQPWKVAVHGDYALPIGTHKVFAGIDFTSAGGYRGDLSSHTEITSYNVLDARIGMRSQSGAYEATLWIRNAMSEDYYVTKIPAGSFNTGAVFGVMGDPRTYGLSLRISL